MTTVGLGDLGRGGTVFETSSGTKIAVYTYNQSIYVKKNLDTTPAQLVAPATFATIHGTGSGSFLWLDAAIDSNDTIHVISTTDEANHPRSVSYNTITDPDGTPAWGTWEEAVSLTQAVSDASCAITIDLSDDPHILFVDNVKKAGSSQDNVYYAEKTGASWSGATQIGLRATKTDSYGLPKMSCGPSGSIQVSYRLLPDDNHTHRYWSGSSWESEVDWNDALVVINGIIITTGNTVYRYHMSGTSIKENNSGIGVTADYPNDPVAPVLVDDSDRYLFYVDNVDHDVDLVTNDGGGWTAQGTLQTGTYEHIVAAWAYWTNNNTGSIDYLYASSGTIYWDEYVLSDTEDNLIATGITTTPVLDTPAIGQTHALTVTEITANPVLETPALGQEHSLTVTEITANPVLGTPSLSESHTLVVTEITANPVLETPALGQEHSLTVTEITVNPVLETPALGQEHSLTVTEITANPVVGTPTLGIAPTGDVVVATVRVACNTSTGTQDITTSKLGGRTPKLAIFFCVGATADGTPADGVSHSYGVTDGTNQWVVGAADRHNKADTSQNRRRQATDEVVMMLNKNVDGNVEGEANFVEFVTNGVTINWGNAVDSAYLLQVVFFAGSDVSADVGTMELDTSETLTGLSYEPDIVLMSTVGTSFDDTAQILNNLFSGFCVNDGSESQAAIAHANNNSVPPQVSGIIYDDHIISNVYANSINRDFYLSAFTSDGFTIVQDVGSINLWTGYATLNFNGKANAWVGVIDTRIVTTGTKATTGVGFTPQALLMLPSTLESVGVVDNTGLGGTAGHSFVDATDEYCSSIASEDLANPTNTQSLSTARALDVDYDDGTIAYAADLQSFDSDGFTLDYTAIPSTACKIAVLAIAEVADDTEDALIATGITTTPVMGTPAIGQEHDLDSVDITANPVTGIPVLGQVHDLVVSDITATPVLETPALGQEHSLTVTEITVNPVLETPALNEPSIAGFIHFKRRYKNPRNPQWRPYMPSINWQSPQAHGLAGLIIAEPDMAGEVPWDVSLQPGIELTRGVWPDTVELSSAYFPFADNFANFGPAQSQDINTSVRSGFTLIDKLWQSDKFTLTAWSGIPEALSNSNWGVITLGVGQNQDHARISLNTSTGMVQGRYEGSLADVGSNAQPTGINEMYLMVATFDKGDLMRVYINGAEKETADISGVGNLDAATKRLYMGYNSQGSMAEVRYYQRVLSPEEIWQMWSQETRWDLYKPTHRIFDIGPPSTTDELTATGITANPVLDTPALGQEHSLTVTEITVNPVLDTPAIGQIHDLDAVDISATPVLDTPAIGQEHALTAVDISATPVLETSVLEEIHVLAAVDITTTPVLESPSLGQTHALSSTDITATPVVDTPVLFEGQALLAVDITATPVVESPGLGQEHDLTIVDISTTPVLDVPAIGQEHDLTAVGISITPVLDTPELSETQNLLATGIVTTPVLETSALGQEHVLSITGITTTSVLGTPTLSTQGVDGLDAQGIAATPALGTPVLGQTHVLSATDISTTPTVDTSILDVIHNLVATEITVSPLLAAPALGQIHALIASEITATPVLETPDLGGTHILIANEILTTPQVDSTVFGQSHTSDPVDILVLPSLGTPTLGQNHAMTATGTLAIPVIGVPDLADRIVGYPVDILFSAVYPTAEVSAVYPTAEANAVYPDIEINVLTEV